MDFGLNTDKKRCLNRNQTPFNKTSPFCTANLRKKMGNYQGHLSQLGKRLFQAGLIRYPGRNEQFLINESDEWVHH